MDFPGVAPPYQVVQNDCRPLIPDDPGFALLTTDNWYVQNPQYAGNTARYGNNHAKRDEQWLDPEEIVLENGNFSRKPTEEELRDRFGFRKCADSTCEQEMKELGIKSAKIVAPPVSTPVSAGTAQPSATESSGSSLASASHGSGSPVETASGSGSEHVVVAARPRETGSLVAEGLRQLLGKL